MTRLFGQGTESNRLSTSGQGEGSPAAGNDTSTGRQQNRRVEVIISNATTASR
jgi:flagellar motor protein MotB